MKLKFLLEQKNKVEDIAKIIIKDCLSFIKQSEMLPLYRGMSNYGDFFKRSVRKNRRPLMGMTIFFNYIDKELKKKFRAYRSNSIICTGDYKIARGYGEFSEGKAFLIFPIHKFYFTYSTKITDYINDLTHIINNEGFKLLDGRVLKSLEDDEDIDSKIIAKSWWEFVKETYVDKDLHRRIELKNEMMISCEEYYAIDAKYEGKLYAEISRLY